MAMTSAQAATFKAAVVADAALAAFRTAGDAGAIAAYYNAPGTGLVWRPSITVPELNTAIVWSEFIAATVARQNGYFALIQGGSVDATKANIQAGFSTIFAGSVSLTNLTALAQRVPTRYEQLFVVSGVTPQFGAAVSVAEVGVALVP